MGSNWKLGRRFVVTLIAMAMVMLNKKMGMDLSTEEIFATAGTAAAYVLGKSVDNAAAVFGAKKAETEKAPKPTTPAS